jgi:hypothetical protein
MEMGQAQHSASFRNIMSTKEDMRFRLKHNIPYTRACTTDWADIEEECPDEKLINCLNIIISYIISV